MESARTIIPEIVLKYEDDLLNEWVDCQLKSATLRRDLMRDDDLREQSRRFLQQLRGGMSQGVLDPDAATWDGARDLLVEFSRERARLGFSPSETAMFVFSLKQP